MTTSLEKKGKSTRCGSYDQIGKAVFYWFIGERSQKVPIDGIMLKEKALEFAKTLGIKEFKASDCWPSKWKKRYKYNNSFLFALFCTTLNCIVLHFVLHLPSFVFYNGFPPFFLGLRSSTCKELAFRPRCQDWILCQLWQLCILHLGLLWGNKIFC